MSATTKVPLSSVVTKTTGGGTPERDNPEFWNGGIPWASVKDFKDGIYRLSKTKEEISEKGLKRSASHLIPAGTPIVCTRMAVGRIARASVPVAINQDLRALHIRDEFDTDYVVWAVDSIRHRIENLAIGSTVKGISIDQLLSFEIEAPPKPEQTKIAEILSTVGRAIEQTEALIAKQQRLKTGLMQDLLTRGIDEHGNLRSERTHKFKDSSLGRIPVEWEAGTLGQMAEFLSGYAFKNHELTEHGWRVVRISNLHKPDFPYWHYQGPVRDSWVIRSGDILFSWAGVASSIDCVRYEGEDALLNQHIYNFKFADELTKSFVYLFLQYYLPILRTEIEGGAGQLHLTKDKIQSIRIPNIPTLEMEAIVSALEGVENSLASYSRQLSKAKVLKTALMQDLLTGRMRVTTLLDGKEDCA
jgi:type I restriction enzyme S subunit